jgi:hypothetical protein
MPQKIAYYFLEALGSDFSNLMIDTERLRARDHYNSGTLIGEKGGAGPSSLHTALEGPTEYVIA